MVLSTYFIPLNEPYFSVSLYALWIFIVENGIYDYYTVVVLEVRFSPFPRIHWFLFFVFLLIVKAVTCWRFVCFEAFTNDFGRTIPCHVRSFESLFSCSANVLMEISLKAGNQQITHKPTQKYTHTQRERERESSLVSQPLKTGSVPSSLYRSAVLALSLEISLKWKL